MIASSRLAERFVDTRRWVERGQPAGTLVRSRGPEAAGEADAVHPACCSGVTSFPRPAPWSTSMSRERSATSFVRHRFAALRSLRRLSSGPCKPPYVCFQRYQVVSVMPKARAASARVAPLVSSSSPSASLRAICSGVWRLLPFLCSPSRVFILVGNLTERVVAFQGGQPSSSRPGRQTPRRGREQHHGRSNRDTERVPRDAGMVMWPGEIRDARCEHGGRPR